MVNKSSIAILRFFDASMKSLNERPNIPHLALILSILLSSVLNIILLYLPLWIR